MSVIKDESSGPDQLDAAQRRLEMAINRSRSGLVFDTHERLRYAANIIRDNHRELSIRIDEIGDGDVTSSEARAEMREIMQLIDAKHEFDEGIGQ